MTSHPVCCEGEFTKNGKDALQLIRPELAEMLRPWLIGKATEETVFTMPVDAAAEVVRADFGKPLGSTPPVLTFTPYAIPTSRFWSRAVRA